MRLQYADCVDSTLPLEERVERLIAFWRECVGEIQPPGDAKLLSILFMTNQLEAVLQGVVVSAEDDD